MSHPESSGEKFLKEQGLIRRSSPSRQKLLGCLSCLWAKNMEEGEEPAAYGRQIIGCNGQQPGTLYQLLQKLEGSGVIESSWEDIDNRTEARPLRRLYRPADSPLGTAFAESLEKPESCGQTSPPELYQDQTNSRREVISGFIANASLDELQWLTEQAAEQIKKLQDN